MRAFIALQCARTWLYWPNALTRRLFAFGYWLRFPDAAERQAHVDALARRWREILVEHGINPDSERP